MKKANFTAMLVVGIGTSILSANGACLAPPSGLVAWWPAEGNATDVAGANAGTLENGTVFSSGRVGQAFNFDGANDDVRIPASAALNVGAGTGFTMEFWMNPAKQTLAPLVEWNNGLGNWGVHLWQSTDVLVAGDGVGNLVAGIFDTLGNEHHIIAPSGLLTTNVYQHVALTYDKTSGVAVIYHNGSAVKTQNLGVFTPQTSYDLYLGRRTSGAFSTDYFKGSLDEVSLYNRALTATEMAAVFVADGAGKCAPPPAVSCFPPPSGLVAWWPGESNTTDAVGANQGTAGVGVGFGAGKVNRSFQFASSNTGVRIPANASLNVGAGAGFSIECWINPSTPNYGPLVEWNNGTNAFGLHFWVGNWSGPGTLLANLVDGAGIHHYLLSPGGVVVSNTLQHVATTYDKASGVVKLFRNGTVVAQTTLGSVTANTTWDVFIGSRIAGSDQDSFRGTIDEVSIYNRALSTNEILAIYQADSAGKCMAPSPPTAPAIVTGPVTNSANGHAYLLLSGSTWTDAEARAVALGGHLVTVNDAAENNWVFTTFGNYGGTNRELWIGLNDAAVEGTFVWSSSEPVGYTRWYPGEPNNYTNNENYAFIWASELDASGRWADAGNISVDGQGRPICGVVEIGTNVPAVVQIVTGPVTNSANGSAYYLLSGSTWSDAEAKAVALGGHLVTVNDAAESDWVFTTFGNFGGINRELWIGLNDAAVEGTFVWSSSEPVGYTRWYPGEPNNFENEDYGFIWSSQLDASGSWADAANLTVDGQGRPFCGVVEIPSALPPSNPLVPQIATFTPARGSNGTVVTLTGTNFSDVAASNIVYFGAVRAAVTLASPASLTVVVPSGATYAPPSVTVAGLIGQASSPFVPTFDNGGGTIDATAFAPKFDLTVGGIQQVVLIGDMDGDGKADLVTPNASGNTVSVLRNISASGSLSAGAFAAKVDFALPGISYGGTLADVDGDGKLDVIAAINAAGSGTTVTVLRNTSTPGVINSSSFAPGVDFTTATGPVHVAAGDLDGDGRLDLAIACFEGGAVSILRNTSTPGIIDGGSFAPKVDLSTGSSTFDVKLADLDRDGRTDLAVANFSAGVASVIRNVSSVGSLSSDSFAPKVDFSTGSSYDMEIGDLDGDGKPDLAINKFNSAAVAVLRNTSTVGSWTSNSFALPVSFTTGPNPHGMAIGDLDGDGRLDIATGNYTGSSVSVLRNTGASGVINSSSFAAKVDFTTASNPVGISIGDLDGDGRPDLVASTWAGSMVSVLRSTVAPYPPTITQNPTNRTVVAGSPAAFSLGVNGSAPLAYQWRWNGTNIVNATNASYSIAAALESQAGLYSVRVTNLFGAADSSSALLTVLPLPPVPVIYSFAPGKAKVGEAVQLIGTNFSDVAVSNIVYFGAVRALVVAASPASLTVVVPSGATFAPPSVTVAGLSGQAKLPFLPTYLGTPVIDSSSFAPKVDFTATTRQATVASGDLDGDGKPDLMVANFDAATVSVYRNISSNGVLNATSFAPRISFSTGTSPYAWLGDVDGDGKLDILVANNGSGSGNTISVLRNTSTPGILTNSSFAARVNFTTATGPLKIEAGDLDGDGKTDLAVCCGNSRVVSILRNIGTPGVINASTFAARVDVAATVADRDVKLADLDGDGKLDLIVANFTGGSVSVLRNIATRGSLATNSFAPRVNLVTGSLYNIAVGDLDGDGKLDLAVDNRPSSIGVFRNIGAPGSLSSNSFAAKVSLPVSGEPYMVAIGDIDGDGKPDLAASIMNSNAVAVLRNTASPGTINSNSFAARVMFATGTGPRNVVLGDLDADGRPDLAVANLSSTFVSVLKNTVPIPAPPTFTQQPVSQSVVLGDLVTFSANATGGLPLSYQWRFNGDNILGASNNSLTLPEAQLASVGSYSVVVSNGFGATNSSNAVLAVTVPNCTEAPAGLVAWWPGNGNAFDSVGTNHGTLLDGTGFGTGKVAQGFLFGSSADGVQVPANPALDIGAGAGFTIESWINPASLASAPIVEWNNGTNAFGLHFWIGNFGGDRGILVNLVDAGGGHHYLQVGGVMTSNTFQHVAATYDKASGIVRLFRNGAVIGESVLGTVEANTAWDIYIGRRPAGSNPAGFKGTIDETSIYSRALNTNEIAAIYAARGAGKCPLSPTVLSVTPPGWFVNEGQTVSFSAVAVGTAPLNYQWQFGSSPIGGATSPTLTLSNVVFAQSGNYSVIVSNLAGTTTSSNVLLRVNRAPLADAGATDLLLISPNGSNVVAVLVGSHSSDPDGDALTYGWFHTGGASPFDTGVVAVTTLPVGTNHLTLIVNDGMASGSQAFAVEVITTSQAVDRLMALVQSDVPKANALLASLRAALAAIDRSQPQTAINQLEAFKNKVLAQIAPTDPALANQLLADAQAIIDALNGGGAPGTVALEITSISQGDNGKPHLKIRGAAGRVHIVETSTDMVNWTMVGVAGGCGNCEYEFNDTQTPPVEARFYRVVSPK